MSANERGMALGAVIILSVVFAIAAFAAMTMSVSRAQTSGMQGRRLQAQYAAEAGVVFTMQRLWRDPTYCGNPAPPAISGMTVNVTVTNCGAGNSHTVQARVTY